MNENGFIKEKKQPVLTAAGIFAVAAGLVLVYFGFFMLMDANNSMGPDLTDAQHTILKYLSIAGIYLMVNGIFHVVSGFYGAVNSGSNDHEKKIRNYGWILLGFSVLNVVILSLLTDVLGNSFNVILLMVPLGISALYCLGAYLNVKLVKRKQQEGEVL